uniref:Helicase-associated domain-containing protein n=2 Tax=Helicotheca tamesis TaxID=374047 RepID=A0A7S2HVD3_9STRA|mmetsp:Transcript_3092/g.4181  ORF Transcript_3092/g.4181 Transcript_3092/m.4181 type:complete len:157 (+) Transcript_3092:1-471(+)
MVATGDTANKSLSIWVSNQRQHYRLMQNGKTTCMTLERVDKLNKLDFAWVLKKGRAHEPRLHKKLHHSTSILEGNNSLHTQHTLLTDPRMSSALIPQKTFLYTGHEDEEIPKDVIHVEVHSSVTSIGDCAFIDCKSLISVTLPPSVTSIGKEAFYN